MDMIEKVAEAIREHVAVERGWGGAASVDGIEDAARAAVEAMREPTSDMVTAGIVDPGEWFADDTTEQIWKRMVDAALKSTP